MQRTRSAHSINLPNLFSSLQSQSKCCIIICVHEIIQRNNKALQRLITVDLLDPIPLFAFRIIHVWRREGDVCECG
jgi:hypothetical protein